MRLVKRSTSLVLFVSLEFCVIYKFAFGSFDFYIVANFPFLCLYECALLLRSPVLIFTTAPPTYYSTRKMNVF